MNTEQFSLAVWYTTIPLSSVWATAFKFIVDLTEEKQHKTSYHAFPNPYRYFLVHGDSNKVFISVFIPVQKALIYNCQNEEFSYVYYYWSTPIYKDNPSLIHVISFIT